LSKFLFREVGLDIGDEILHELFDVGGDGVGVDVAGNEDET
jgi:hypothetical protein